MTETVTVAMITALAALAGSALSAGLTSWITLRNTSRQAEYQLALARDDRTEQRAVIHRASRRDAYVSFLSDALSCAALIRLAREQGLADGEFDARAVVAEEALGRLVAAHALIAVEGPPALFAPAAEVRAALHDELKVVRAVRDLSSPESDLDAARRRRAAAVGSLAGEARAAIGGDIDTSR